MLPIKLGCISSLVLLAVWVFVQTEATDIWLFTDDHYSKKKSFKKFNFGTSQRCYSLVDCFDNKASSASWINTPDAARFVFYDGEECSGLQYSSIATRSGEMEFDPVGLDKKISSFMLWEYGTYPVKGIVNYCKEAAILDMANNTANSTEHCSGSNDGSTAVGQRN